MITEGERQPESRDTQVCIVGAGLVGIYLGVALRDHGIDVVMLETGGHGAAPFAAPTFTADEYEGATSGRFQGLGGTSTAWGGQLAPLAEHEMRECLEGQPEPWPFGLGTLRPYYAEVFRRYGLRETALETIWRGAPTHSIVQPPGFALSLKTSARNAARFWRKPLRGTGLTVVLGAGILNVATTKAADGAQVREVSYRTREGGMRTLRCQVLVICAGALESTRFVQRFFPTSAPGDFVPGQTLQDHLSLRVASLEIIDLDAFRDAFSPRFTRDGVLFRRHFCVAGSRGIDGFLHAVYAEDDGFPRWLHDVVRHAQNGQGGAFTRRLLDGPRHASSMLTLLSGAALRRRVEWPRTTRFDLLLDVEQLPDASNAIVPGDGATRIHWRATAADRANAERLVRAVREEWENGALRRAARLVDSGTEIRARVAYHPTGTLRMGSRRATGAVDMDCRLHGTSNAFVLSTATFPRCGAGNPSFTLLALASRAVPTIESSLP